MLRSPLPPFESTTAGWFLVRPAPASPLPPSLEKNTNKRRRKGLQASRRTKPTAKNEHRHLNFGMQIGTLSNEELNRLTSTTCRRPVRAYCHTFNASNAGNLKSKTKATTSSSPAARHGRRDTSTTTRHAMNKTDRELMFLTARY